MKRWLFYPLRDYPHCGVIVSPDGKPAPAEYLSLDEARRIAQQKKQEKAA